MKKFLKDLAGSFVPAFEKGIFEIRFSFKRLAVRILVHDFVSVASSIGFVILPAFLIGFIFLLLPQGRDTLLLVVENLSTFNFWPIFFLLLGIAAWSMVSELSVRYAIYISDNSGKNLSDDRVAWRKTVQKLLAAAFLLWPSFIVLVSMFWCMLSATYMEKLPRFLCFGICFILIYWLMSFLSNLYFRKSGKASAGVYLKTKLGERSLPDREQQYLRKLYGIYQDFIYTLPKSSSFQKGYKEALQRFTDYFTKSTEGFAEGFPQNPDVLIETRMVPAEFNLIDREKLFKGRGELYKWTYQIPASFYEGLHRQIKLFAGVSFLLFLSISLIPGWWPVFSWIGAPALICFAFACYTGIYTGLLYLDKSLLRKWKISVRFLLFMVLIVCSFYNQDHPVRMADHKTNKRESVVDHFNRWFMSYKANIDKQKGDHQQKYPVVFICAEGGALRTGAYTSLFLSSLSAKLEKEKNVDFKKSIFAMSGVSGGAVGLGLYNALTFENKVQIPSGVSAELAKKFFQHDTLSPIIGKMLFGDFLNLFLPVHISLFDRSIALEKSWEQAYQSLIDKNKDNIFSRSFASGKIKPNQPLFVINTAEVETGLQCWVSNLMPDSLAFKNQRDLLAEKVNDLNYSTAINFSTRFPLFSPAAKVGGLNGNPRLHYLDGGYVENTGSASMLEVLQLLKSKSTYFNQITPIVITLLFSEEDKTTPNIRFGNEFVEILNALTHTRSGNSKISRFRIKQFLNEGSIGFAIDEPLTAEEKNVPMNWVLSAQSMNNITRDIEDKLNNTSETGIMSKLLKNNLNFYKVK
ncbi:patatin-like phospholipase family protein [uncultured Pedobacter sp.]|uniref:patatin-like phospholipase family protein n=1 Tax=uncultured Pedobacter sp. TaxID=246139 RepID=UPI0025CB793C|nr:patatin-like phospholipase family protein [uncultured Pedobacter sp.]